MYEQKRRHGCVTAWLLLMIFSNSLVTLAYLFAQGAIAKTLPSGDKWAVPTVTLIGILNIVLIIALLRWKKLGFFGLVCTAIATFLIDITIGVNAGYAIFGLAGVVLLFVLLQIGGERSAWDQLD